MVTSSASSSVLNRLVGCLGGWLGFLLVMIGLLWVALSLLLRFAADLAASLPIDLPAGDLPLWGGVIPLVLGAVCYVWGWGMMRYRGWAPFVATLFLGNVALYVWLFGNLLTRRVCIPEFGSISCVSTTRGRVREHFSIDS
jgi:hypothetical protein